MGKPESFSFHSSILYAVDLFLKLHKHHYGKKIRKRSHRRGESVSPENIYLKTFMCVFAQLRLACLATSHSYIVQSEKTRYNRSELEQSLPLYRPGKWKLSVLSASYLSALEPPWNSASAETRAASHYYIYHLSYCDD